MSLFTTTLRPGLLVSLKTSVAGNVRYSKTQIEPEHVTEAGTQEATWETTRTVYDPDEHKVAIQLRSKIRWIVTAVCAQSAFGLLCPEASADKLEEAIAETRKLAAAFNAQAKCTKVQVFVIAGRVAADDVEAVRSINSEVRDLLTQMTQGIQRLDVKAIRDAADRSKSLGSMLSTQAQERIQEAIKAARTVASKISKAGATAAAEIDQQVLATLAQARTSFLDLDEQHEIAAPAVEGRAIDLTGTPVSDAEIRSMVSEGSLIPVRPALELEEIEEMIADGRAVEIKDARSE